MRPVFTIGAYALFCVARVLASAAPETENITFRPNDAAHFITCLAPNLLKSSTPKNSWDWDWWFQKDSTSDWQNVSDIFPDMKINGSVLEFPELNKNFAGTYVCAARKPANGVPYVIYDETLQGKWHVTVYEENDEPESENNGEIDETTETSSTSNDSPITTTTMTAEPSSFAAHKSKSSQLCPSSGLFLMQALLALIYNMGW